MRDFFKPGIDDAETDSSIGLSDLEDQVFHDNVFSPAADEEHIEEVDMNDPDFDCETDDDSDEDDEDDSDDSDDTDEDENDNRNSMPGTSSDRANNSGLDDEDEEDETVRAIIAAIKKPRSHPPEIKVDDFVTDISFHPDEDIIAIANILGDIVLYKYTNEENTLLNTFEVHTNSCRDVEFSEDGRTLLSGSKDKAIMVTDVETGKLVKFYDGAHNAPIYKLYVIDENLFSTGDDSGTVKVWDIRTQDSVFSIRKVEDCITGMLTNDSKKLLLCTSGDGYLTTISIGARKMYVQSEPYAEELTCMGLYRNDSKLVVGTSKGKLYTFNWGQFGYHCDMFPGMKTPINVMLPLTDRIGCVAGEEGILRAAHVAPFRNLGIVGQHTLPVESMDINHSGELIASSSHNNDVRFWNVKYFEDFGDIKYNEKHNPHKEKQHNLPSSKFSNATDFFADLA